MSKYMLSDQNAINDINPFVMVDFSLPGTSAKPYNFATYQPRVEEPSMFDGDEKSVICDFHSASAPNLCQNPKPNCPMSRRILPERVIQYEDGTVNTELNGQSKKDIRRKNNNTLFLIVLIIVLIALLFLIR